jgi:ADP-ribose pyrophosphatase YjhB (NUDIX family)
MKYCSQCGTKIFRRYITNEQRERYMCAACGVIHYQNPRVIVSCTVCWHDKILLCRRSQEPARGQWTIPSGFLECGEALEEGAARETFEETGVLIDPTDLELHTVANMVAIEQVAIGFRIDLATLPVVRAGPECLEVGFYSEAEIPANEWAWRASLGKATQRCFNEIRLRDYTIQLTTLGSSQGVGFKSREYKIISATNIGDAHDWRGDKDG